MHCIEVSTARLDSGIAIILAASGDRKGIEMSNLETAIAVASAAHMGQLDKRGDPFILHPIRVMLVQTTLQTRIVAILHDMVASSDTSFNDLYSFGFDDDIALAVNSITRRDEEDYFEFIRRASRNPLSRPVKIADLRDNLQMVTETGDVDARERYIQALQLLGEQA